MILYEIKKMPLGETTTDGSYYVDIVGGHIGENGRTHWQTRKDAFSFAERFIYRVGQHNLRLDNHKTAEEIKEETITDILSGITSLCDIAHSNSTAAGWWNCPETGEDLLSNPSYAPYVLAAKMMLMVSETAEAMEGLRKDLADDKLPQYSMEGCELADIMIRIADYAGKRGIPLGQIVVDKMSFNTTRPDHKVDNRRKTGGKKF